MPAPFSTRPSTAPAWLGWAQLSLSTTLLVLFLVVLVRSHGQVQQLRQLQGRLTTLESQRSSERAATQETQLHSFARRLDALEQRQEQRAAAQEADRAALAQALAALRNQSRPALPEEEAREEPPPPRRAGVGALPALPLRPPDGPGVSP